MFYVFGVYQQGKCAARFQQDDVALGSSNSLDIGICKRPFSEK